MVRPAADTLARLADVFRRTGYDGASLSRMSAATGLGRASLYHQFPDGKRAIALGAVADANRRFGAEVLDRVAAAGADPRDRLRVFARALARYYGDGDDPCLLGVLTLGDIEPALRDRIRAGFETWVVALAAILVDAGIARPVARQRAEDAIAQVQGALLLGRALGHHKPLKRALARWALLTDG